MEIILKYKEKWRLENAYKEIKILSEVFFMDFVTNYQKNVFTEYHRLAAFVLIKWQEL